MGTIFSFEYMIKSFPTLLSMVDVTILVTVVSEFFAIILGCIIALTRINAIRLLDKVCAVYVSFIRGTPFLVQLYLICFGMPQVLNYFGMENPRSIPGILYVFLVMSLHEGGYIAEIMRGSILAVDKGQMEAAKSIGMTGYSAYTRVVIPQAFRMAIPALGNNVVSTLKSTALIFNVGVVDMMRRAELMGAFSYRHLELYIDIAVIYICLCFLVQLGTMLLERCTRMKNSTVS